MCYKVSHTGRAEDYEKRFSAKFNPTHLLERKEHYHANGFAFPGLPVITQENPQEIEIAEWGLVPHFAFNDAEAKKYRVGNLNAKAETAFELRSFKKPILEHRCMVLANGFYESVDVNGESFPYFIYRR